MHITAKTFFLSFTLLTLSYGTPLKQQTVYYTNENSTLVKAEAGWVCPAIGYDCLFNDIERVNDVGTWQECARQCLDNRTCAFWSWRTTTSNINPRGCWLKSACPLASQDSRVISGEYTCTAKA